MTTHGGGIEVIRPAVGRRFACAVLDFDGTISLIREGWQDVMIPMMVEALTPLDHGMDAAAVEALVREDVTVLTGAQTIYQMIRLAERVKQFGGSPADPRGYKAEYDRRLMARIDHRREALAAGDVKPHAFMLAGARAMLDELLRRGLKLYLTSGTDEPYLIEEAKLLGVDGHFAGGVHGAREDYKTFSKAMVIQRLIEADGIDGPELLGVGDGFVEIANTREVGGYAVGVASDEVAGGGEIDQWKRRRLIQAGADLIIPDFAQLDALTAALFEGA